MESSELLSFYKFYEKAGKKKNPHQYLTEGKSGRAQLVQLLRARH